MPRPLEVGFLMMPTENPTTGVVPRWTDILAMARRGEALGYDSLWIPDHLIIDLPRPGSEPEGAWEAWSLVAALAAATERIQIGLLVTCTAFRNPALLAKIADTCDEISGGRLILGVGAGWCQREFDAFGYPFDHRVGRFAEAVDITSHLLREGRYTYEGKYYQVQDCELRPRGPRPEGPPILVGSSSTGERMMRLAARYADIWNRDFDAINPEHAPYSREDLLRSQERIDAACVEVGRDPATLTRTCGVWVDLPGGKERGWDALTGSPEEMAAGLRKYAETGFSGVQIWLNQNDTAGIEAFAPVLQILDRD